MRKSAQGLSPANRFKNSRESEENPDSPRVNRDLVKCRGGRTWKLAIASQEAYHTIVKQCHVRI